MLKRYTVSLPLPILCQSLVILLYQGAHRGILETCTALCFIAFFPIGPLLLVVLLFPSIAQILTARSLVKSDANYGQLFLVGLLNPSIAIVSILTTGLLNALLTYG